MSGRRSLAVVLADLERKPGFGDEYAFATAHVGPMESDLERLFLARWVEMVLGCGSTAYGGKHLRTANFTQPSPWFLLDAQQWVLDRYRADFLLRLKTADGVDAGHAAIECDGYAHHHDLRAFSKDRTRDQAFLAAGIPTFRFTWGQLANAQSPLGLLLQWSRRTRPLPARGEAVSIGASSRAVLIDLIAREPDPSERKARIMTAWEHGHLTAEEAEEWIVLDDLGAA